MLSIVSSNDENLPSYTHSVSDCAEDNGIPWNTSSKSQLAPVTPGPSRTVSFCNILATVVDEVDDEADPEVIWYTKKELRSFRASAKTIADRLRVRQPSLVQELAEAYEMAKEQAGNGPINNSLSAKPFGKWSKLGSSRRGLERFVFPKQDRATRIEEVKASRSIAVKVQFIVIVFAVVNVCG